jgi:hypothetical protein
VKPAEVLRAARRQVAELTGFGVESVSSFERNGDDAWVVTVEVLELERVPNTMDLLGSYEVKLSDDGDITSFRRRRRYHRAAAEDGRG